MSQKLEVSLKLIKVNPLQHTASEEVSFLKLIREGRGNLLVWVEAGKILFTNPSGEKIEVSANEVIILSGHLHNLLRFSTFGKEKGAKKDNPALLAEGAVRYYALSFEAKMSKVIDVFFLLKIHHFRMEKDSFLEKIRNLFFTEVSKEQLGSQEILATYSKLLIMHFLRKMMSSESVGRKYLAQIKNLIHPKLVILLRYINKNLGANLSSGLLAQQVNISKDYIGQFFKNHTCWGLRNYIRSARLEKAGELLLTPDCKNSIKEVSEEVGFKNFSYFCREFRKYWGVPAGCVYLLGQKIKKKKPDLSTASSE